MASGSLVRILPFLAIMQIIQLTILDLNLSWPPHFFPGIAFPVEIHIEFQLMLLRIDVGIILCAPIEIHIEFQLLLVQNCQQSNDDTAVLYSVKQRPVRVPVCTSEKFEIDIYRRNQ